MKINRFSQSPQNVGTRKHFIGDFIGPASYVNGTGVQINAGDFLFNRSIGIMHISNSQDLLYAAKVIYDKSGSQASFYVKFYVIATGAEVANGVDLSGKTFRIEAWGK
jgi:hypothetical protein